MALASQTKPEVQAVVAKTGMSTSTPVSAAAGFTEAVAAGGVNIAFANAWRGINAIDLSLFGGIYKIIRRADGVGSLLIPILKYDNGLTAPTPPVIAILGRSNIADPSGDPIVTPFIPLLNAAGSHLTTLTMDTTEDADDGAFKWTRPNAATQGTDPLWCNEFMVFPDTPLSGTGTVTNAVIYLAII